MPRALRNLLLDGNMSPNNADEVPSISLTLNATGNLVAAKPGMPATPAMPPSRVDFCQIQTTIMAPLGHAVVLGVTPTQKVTSAFVIQLRPSR